MIESSVASSSEVQEFLAAVTQLLGDEIFQLFLGELTSLRSLIQNKKIMFAQKVRTYFIKYSIVCSTNMLLLLLLTLKYNFSAHVEM